MWLEIDGDVIIGVHAQRCSSPFLWIEHVGGAVPGDRFDGENVVPRRHTVGETEARRRAAHAHIVAVYPLWKQLNILREGDTNTITAMGHYIDACRAWSNDNDAPSAQLNSIQP